MKALLAIFLGGGCGSLLRYCVQLLMHEKITPYNFPWATFTVNILGCMMIGLFYALSAKFCWSTEIRLLLTAGLCGGFTTFSTFGNDMLELISSGEMLLFLLYACLSLLLGLGAVYLGAQLARVF